MTDIHGSPFLHPLAHTRSLPRVPAVENRNFALLGALSAVLVGDILALFAGGVLASTVQWVGSQSHSRSLYIAVVLYLFAAWTLGTYRLAILRAPAASVSRALLSLFIAVSLLLVAAYSFQLSPIVVRQEMLVWAATSGIALAAFRLFVAAGFLRHATAFSPGLVLLGDGSVRSADIRQPVTEINVRRYGWLPSQTDPNFLNDLSRAIAGADRIVLSFQSVEERQQWRHLVAELGLNAELLEPNVAALKPLALEYFGTTPTLVVSRGPLTSREWALKRAFDLMLVVLTSPVVVPLACLLAILVRLDSPGPVLFVQTRIGMNNRYFQCYKYRTMRFEATDYVGNSLTQRNDPRITRVGTFLRRTSLDELPQLWNVLKGEMSWVGPRPHALGASAEGALYWEAVPGYWQRHSVKPGLTGLAQVRGYRGPTGTRREIENRVASDLEYVKSWSLWLDIRILAKTLTVLIHQNAF